MAAHSTYVLRRRPGLASLSSEPLKDGRLPVAERGGTVDHGLGYEG